jgi:hypothetical protein
MEDGKIAVLGELIEDSSGDPGNGDICHWLPCQYFTALLGQRKTPNAFLAPRSIAWIMQIEMRDRNIRCWISQAQRLACVNKLLGSY